MPLAQILIVDDDPIATADLTTRLQAMGHAVLNGLGSSHQATQLAVKHRPDLVLLELRLRGGADGVELASMLQSALETPVVFVTAAVDDAALQRMATAQPYGCLHKPCGDAQLRATIALALTRRAAEARLLRGDRQRLATLNALPQPVLSIDVGGNVLLANAAASAVLGAPCEQIVGRPAVEVLGLAAQGLEVPRPGDVIVAVLPTGPALLRCDLAPALFATDPEFVVTIAPTG